MVIFISSLRHPDSTDDYQRCLDLLTVTMSSIAQQTDPNFRMIITCNSNPDLDFKHERFEFRALDIACPPLDRNGRVPIEAVKRDKGLKLLYAFLAARKYNPDYVVILDSDDFVNTKLVEFLNGHKDFDGWFVDYGYTLDRRTLRCQRKAGLFRYCGSTHIVNFRRTMSAIEALSSMEVDPSVERILDCVEPGVLEEVFGDHPQTISRLRKKGIRLSRLPFFGAVWSLETGQNHSNTRFQDIGVPLGESVRTDFGLNAMSFTSTAVQPDVFSWVRESLVFLGSLIGSRLNSIGGRKI